MQVLIKFETGPTAADCYQQIVTAPTVELARQEVVQRLPRAMITEARELLSTDKDLTPYWATTVLKEEL